MTNESSNGTFRNPVPSRPLLWSRSDYNFQPSSIPFKRINVGSHFQPSSSSDISGPAMSYSRVPISSKPVSQGSRRGGKSDSNRTANTWTRIGKPHHADIEASSMYAHFALHLEHFLTLIGQVLRSMRLMYLFSRFRRMVRPMFTWRGRAGHLRPCKVLCFLFCRRVRVFRTKLTRRRCHRCITTMGNISFLKVGPTLVQCRFLGPGWLRISGIPFRQRDLNLCKVMRRSLL